MVEPVQESLRSQAVAGVIWTALQKWSVRFSTFIAFLVLGRLLSPSEFGIVALAMAFIVLMTVLADAGFATYLVQARRLTDEMKNTAFVIATGSGLVLALLLSAAAYPLSRLLDVPELASVLPALSVSLVFVGLSSVPAALLTRELKFQQLAMRQVLATLLSVIAAVALAAAGAGVWSLVAQTLVRQVVASAVLMAATDFRPRLSFSGGEAKSMLSYSTKAMGAQILSQVSGQGEVLLIGAFAGPVALGLWTIASRVVNVLTDLFGTVIGTVASPLFARVQRQPKRLGRAIFGAESVGALVLVPALGALALVSPQLIPDVFGSQWSHATTIASLLAVRGVVVALSRVDRSVLLTGGHAGGELKVIAAITALHCGLVAAFAGHGIKVLAGVVMIEALVIAPLRPVLIHRWLRVPYSAWSGVRRVVLSGSVASLLSLLVLSVLDVNGPATYAVVVVFGGALYAMLVLLLARPVVDETRHTLSLLLARRRRHQPAAATFAEAVGQ